MSNLTEYDPLESSDANRVLDEIPRRYWPYIEIMVAVVVMTPLVLLVIYNLHHQVPADPAANHVVH